VEKPPRIVTTHTKFAGHVFDIHTDEVQYSDGAVHRVDVVEHAASLGILAIPAPNELVMVRQYRHAARDYVWEIPAGMAEPNESLEDGARRELREETGFTAERLTKIGAFWTTPGFCSEVMHLYYAEGLLEGSPQFADDERIEIGRFTIETAWRLLAHGTADMKTAIALLWLQGRRSEIGSDSCR
jgi:ADP-ribose pyrophosphatase